MAHSYTKRTDTRAMLGLIALQSDRTIEDDLRRLMPSDVSLLVSRVPSRLEVTLDTLAEMEGALSGAASLFPVGHNFGVVGYGCTSGTAQIGAQTVAARVQAGTDVQHVTQPLSALIAACKALNLRRIAILSPYVASVSDRLRDVLRDGGIDSPALGSFDEANEAAVAQIDDASIMDASGALMADGDLDGLFLSCTNLRTLDVVAPLQERFGVPVLSSNLVLAWHMLQLAGKAVPTPRELL